MEVVWAPEGRGASAACRRRRFREEGEKIKLTGAASTSRSSAHSRAFVRFLVLSLGLDEPKMACKGAGLAKVAVTSRAREIRHRATGQAYNLLDEAQDKRAQLKGHCRKGFGWEGLFFLRQKRLRGEKASDKQMLVRTKERGKEISLMDILLGAISLRSIAFNNGPQGGSNVYEKGYQWTTVHMPDVMASILGWIKRPLSRTVKHDPILDSESGRGYPPPPLQTQTCVLNDSKRHPFQIGAKHLRESPIPRIDLPPTPAPVVSKEFSSLPPVLLLCYRCLGWFSAAKWTSFLEVNLGDFLDHAQCAKDRGYPGRDFVSLFLDSKLAYGFDFFSKLNSASHDLASRK
ncbi:hypothetical protein BKA70DRAFT_1473552 [Coprinopsis sp. MPI-PUGE-AT-0042]|nr:hypothetical protein BKA70DRAFT_1473552 [Coprinopsis sp. MPI-PUGE-AT-0042]